MPFVRLCDETETMNKFIISSRGMKDIVNPTQKERDHSVLDDSFRFVLRLHRQAISKALFLGVSHLVIFTGLAAAQTNIIVSNPPGVSTGFTLNGTNYSGSQNYYSIAGGLNNSGVIQNLQAPYSLSLY
ncbi:MAG: hypothetical protein FGM26_13915, partial [Beijerinckiaceae bacterium]|nr:hypothetical protein [Beijerinckiaceae bacterium]